MNVLLFLLGQLSAAAQGSTESSPAEGDAIGEGATRSSQAEASSEDPDSAVAGPDSEADVVENEEVPSSDEAASTAAPQPVSAAEATSTNNEEGADQPKADESQEPAANVTSTSSATGAVASGSNQGNVASAKEANAEAVQTTPNSIAGVEAVKAGSAKLLFWGFQLGLPVTGATNIEQKCSETANLQCGANSISDSSETSFFALGARVGVQPLPWLRVAAATQWIPWLVGQSQGNTRRYGTEGLFTAQVEGLWRLGEMSSLVLGASGGWGFLFQGKFHDQVERQNDQDCNSIAASGLDCEWSMNLRPSWTLGGHLATLIGKEEGVRVRVELAAQYVRTPLYQQDVTAGGESLHGNVWLQSARGLLMVGPEF